MASVSASLVILGCSQRKRQTSRVLPAIDRYDGPAFRVLRKYSRDAPGRSPLACVLSARFGLIPGDLLIPRYERRFGQSKSVDFHAEVERQLRRMLDTIQPDRLFVSVGSEYWPLIEKSIGRDAATSSLVIAKGGIGGRASQLAHWLRASGDDLPALTLAQGEATLLGTTVRLSPAEVLDGARKALVAKPHAARRFETWYVAVGSEHVAPKWLVSILFDKPVARFRTADARRVLRLLGVEVKYAD